MPSRDFAEKLLKEGHSVGLHAVHTKDYLLLETIKMINDMEVKEKYQEVTDEFAQKAMRKYKDKIDGIILFGSVARGEAKEESDIDILMVVVGDRFKMRRELSGIVLDVLLETGKYISVKTLSMENFKFLREIKTSFLSSVITEGVYIERGKVIA